MKTIVTITGIRPDFIRMCKVFKKLDENFNHILIHSGQHYDEMLSDIFFKDLNIRKPDYNLHIGGPNKPHYEQTAELSIKIINLLKENNINPDLILFLGDSNSVLCSVPLKKEGYKIGHIEAGMRSGDIRMFEEINRTVCDLVSDYFFVYHEDYKQNLIKENKNPENIFVVGNTITEVVKEYSAEFQNPSCDYIVADIHRPENFNDIQRLQNIILYLNYVIKETGFPCYLLHFTRLDQQIAMHHINLGQVQRKNLMSYKMFLQWCYNSCFIVSDSGTAQEEPAFLNVPVICPRDFTERPASCLYKCSYMLNVNENMHSTWPSSLQMINNHQLVCDTSWLDHGITSSHIIDILNNIL